jgi:hypothetical protein
MTSIARFIGRCGLRHDRRQSRSPVGRSEESFVPRLPHFRNGRWSLRKRIVVNHVSERGITLIAAR